MNKIIKTLKRVKWGRLAVALLILTIFVYGVIAITKDIISLFDKKESTEEVQDIVEEQKQVEQVEEQVSAVEPIIEEPVVAEPIVEEPIVEPEVEQVPDSKAYRLTSYYPEESSDCTGSGLCSWDFGIDEHGWYTYNGKLVLAAATQECLRSHYGACNKWNEAKSGRKYFRYYEEIEVVIDGISYEAIILDSCGASMYLNEDRIDLFVSGSSYTIDRGYKGVNMVTVYADYS